MIFSTKNRKKTLKLSYEENMLKIDNKNIELVCEYKYLGVWIDSNLTFAKHVKSIISNVSFRLKKLSRIQSCITKQTSLLLYKSMIVPLFDYGDVFFDQSCKKELTKRLQSLQNYAIRIINQLPPRTITTNDEKELNLLPLEKRRWLHNIQLAFYLASNDENLLPCRGSGVNTRAIAAKRKQLTLFAPKKATTEKSFSYQIRKLWNSLPTTYHSANSRSELTNLL